MKTMDKIDEVLTRGVEKIYPTQDALEKVLRSGKKIKLYQGFDPSMPNLHLGHLVGLIKLKQFQDLGHEVIFLVGDFTGMIGDPTDKSSTRPRLTREQVLKNAEHWQEQAGRILKFEGENPAKILFNSSWLDKVGFKDLIEITSNFTVQQLLERDFFQKRLASKQPIYLHEFLYPVAQAIDCVEMDVDLEIGGNDQTFNMLAGRTLMKVLKGKEKFVLTTKLLVDSQGNKVGKTAGNALFLNASPSDIYGGIMSFPDEVVALGFELLTQVPLQTIKQYKQTLQSNKVNPMDLKKQLAFNLVKDLYGEAEAKEAQETFEKIFQEKEIPTNALPTYPLDTPIISIIDLIIKTQLAPSRSEAKRLVEQRGVEVNNRVITNVQEVLCLERGAILKVGKRKFVKLDLKEFSQDK